MNVIIILARIAHIFSAVLWVGGFATFFLYIQPALNKTMPASQPFFAMFMKGYGPYMAAVSPLTILAGAVLYWNDSAGLNPSWIATGSGLGFTFGALCGITAWIVGLFVVKPRADRMAALGGEISTQGKPPTPEQRAEMGNLGGILATFTRVVFVFLGLAVLAMATARYL